MHGKHIEPWFFRRSWLFLDRAQWLEARGTTLWELGRTNEAVAMVSETATAHRDQPVVLLSAANFLAVAGRFAAEVQWRATLRRQDPKRLDWIIDQGYAEMRAGQAAAAFVTLTEALVLEPTNAAARSYLDQVAARRKQAR